MEISRKIKYLMKNKKYNTDKINLNKAARF